MTRVPTQGSVENFSRASNVKYAADTVESSAGGLGVCHLAGRIVVEGGWTAENGGNVLD